MTRGRAPKLPEITILRDAGKESVTYPPGMKDKQRRAIYRALVRDLMARYLWIDTFIPTIEVLSGAVLDYRRAREKLDTEGSVLETEMGPAVSPWHKVAQDSGATIHRLGREFGWSIGALYKLLREATGNEYRRQMVMEGNTERRSEKASLLPFEHA